MESSVVCSPSFLNYNTWIYQISRILHPLVFGDYPETMRKIAGFRLPSFSSYESELVTHAFDFIGLNHYTSSYTSSHPKHNRGNPERLHCWLGHSFQRSNVYRHSFVVPSYSKYSKGCSVFLFAGTKDAPSSATVRCRTCFWLQILNRSKHLLSVFDWSIWSRFFQGKWLILMD